MVASLSYTLHTHTLPRRPRDKWRPIEGFQIYDGSLALASHRENYFYKPPSGRLSLKQILKN